MVKMRTGIAPAFDVLAGERDAGLCSVDPAPADAPGARRPDAGRSSRAAGSAGRRSGSVSRQARRSAKGRSRSAHRPPLDAAQATPRPSRTAGRLAGRVPDLATDRPWSGWVVPGAFALAVGMGGCTTVADPGAWRIEPVYRTSDAMNAAPERNAAPYAEVATMFESEGRFAQAAQWWAKAVQGARPDPDHLTRFGAVLMRLDRPDEAIAVMARVLELRPGEPSAMNNLAYVYARTGEFGRARDLLVSALAQQPDYTHARKNLAWVNAHLPAVDRAVAAVAPGVPKTAADSAAPTDAPAVAANASTPTRSAAAEAATPPVSAAALGASPSSTPLPSAEPQPAAHRAQEDGAARNTARAEAPSKRDDAQGPAVAEVLPAASGTSADTSPRVAMAEAATPSPAAASVQPVAVGGDDPMRTVAVQAARAPVSPPSPSPEPSPGPSALPDRTPQAAAPQRQAAGGDVPGQPVAPVTPDNTRAVIAGAPHAGNTPSEPPALRPAPPTVTPDDRALRLVVFNGNGLEGAARFIDQYLVRQGWPRARVRNLPSFNALRTTVEYRPGFEAAARALAASLPAGGEVVPARLGSRGPDVRIVLGADRRLALQACQMRGPCAPAPGPREPAPTSVAVGPALSSGSKQR